MIASHLWDWPFRSLLWSVGICVKFPFSLSCVGFLSKSKDIQLG